MLIQVEKNRTYGSGSSCQSLTKRKTKKNFLVCSTADIGYCIVSPWSAPRDRGDFTENPFFFSLVILKESIDP